MLARPRLLSQLSTHSRSCCSFCCCCYYLCCCLLLPRHAAPRTHLCEQVLAGRAAGCQVRQHFDDITGCVTVEVVLQVVLQNNHNSPGQVLLWTRAGCKRIAALGVCSLQPLG